MPHLGFHPAPGFGELMPGSFVVPQNPMRTQLSGIGYIPHIGELMPGAFVVPENPIRRAMAAPTPVSADGTHTMVSVAKGGAGIPGMGGFGCYGSGGCGMGGLSAIDFGKAQTWITLGIIGFGLGYLYQHQRGFEAAVRDAFSRR